MRTLAHMTIAWPNWQTASLKGHPCPYCRKGKMVLRRAENYTVVGRQVPVAYVNTCRDCGREVLTEREWQRLGLPA